MILGSFFGGRFPWHLLGSWVGVVWSCCALRFGIRGPMECLLGVSCRGLKYYKNNGFARFWGEEGWPNGGPRKRPGGPEMGPRKRPQMAKTRAGRKRK